MEEDKETLFMPDYLWSEIIYLKKMGVSKDLIKKEIEFIEMKFVVSANPFDNKKTGIFDRILRRG